MQVSPVIPAIRRRLEVRGLVQGVGFRPFAWRLAHELGLGGLVLNHSGGVTIEVEGPAERVAEFQRRLAAELPRPGRVERVEAADLPPTGETVFRIAESRERGGAVALVLPDVATCPACRREIFDPADRRFGYAFTNCTHCGPRFSIVADVPYDRAKTTMRGFVMCPACRAEYEDPADRRFHAQPNACPVCGPQTHLAPSPASVLAPSPCQGEGWGEVQPVCAAQMAEEDLPLPPPWQGGGGPDLRRAVALLQAGGILAVKGLGGYHLACDARNAAAVDVLRARKHRDAKPLAVMVAGLAGARELGVVSEHEAELLTSPEAPIVLLERHVASPTGDLPVAPTEGGGAARTGDLPVVPTEVRGVLAPGIAPGLTTIGVMLAYTPLHHLLLRACGGPLVMTSGNLSDEPIAHLDPDARERLGGLCDAFLVHDRPIQRRCDDSVVRSWRGRTLPLRRSRGYAPAPVAVDLPAGAVVLAVGGHQKNTFCLLRGGEAFLSHHIGDLENDLALSAFETGIADFERLFDLRPEVIAHDLHPDYLATQYALQRGLPRVGVQHHHAHIAACLADAGHPGPVIGVAFDGTGYGPDGTVWGGEFLVADRAEYRRAARLRPFRLAGGEAAVRQPWRVAMELARQAGAAFGAEEEHHEAVAQMLASGFRCVTTSSAGRLFDGFSALLGIRREARYEGEAAVLLEGACCGDAAPLPFAVASSGDLLELDWRPAVAAALRCGSAGEAALAFHRGLALGVVALCRRLREAGAPRTVALSGGCFQNVRLLAEVSDGLSAAGFVVLTHQRVPPNDGGLALGQAVVARALGKAG